LDKDTWMYFSAGSLLSLALCSQQMIEIFRSPQPKLPILCSAPSPLWSWER
jgi:hypothetical protein